MVCKGFHKKTLQTVWLKETEIVLSQIWTLEAQDQDVGRVASPRTSLLGLQLAAFRTHPSHMVHPQCVSMVLISYKDTVVFG